MIISASVGSKAVLSTSGKIIFVSKCGTIRYEVSIWSISILAQKNYSYGLPDFNLPLPPPQGNYEYCCELGMKVFEPATLADFNDYFKLANGKDKIKILRLWNKFSAANVDEAQLGLIGETYMNSDESRLQYYSDDKLVPMEWPALTAPAGYGSFLAFKGMNSEI